MFIPDPIFFHPGFELFPSWIPDPHQRILSISVADPDPHVLGLPDPDPLVRGMDPDPGSGSFSHHAKVVRNTLIPTIL
jgi:hypothetical protein